MSLMQVASANRIHVGFFGCRNAGKSSLVNAVTNQTVSVVSDVAGTTTDPVTKSMELLPLGPVVIVDTPGFDDEGELGELRVERTQTQLRTIDLAVLVIDATQGMKPMDFKLLSQLQKRGCPYLIAWNKCDLCKKPEKAQSIDAPQIFVSARERIGIEELKQALGHLSDGLQKERPLVSDLIGKGDLVLLVVPIDSAAPKGRLILPQQQVLRDVLDADARALVVKENALEQTLKDLKTPPALVVTDSQVFEQVAKNVPKEILLTSFSILMARYKGFLTYALEGAEQIDRLIDGDKVLICEGCTHHRQCGDIGTQKLPAWLSSYTGKELIFDFTSGKEFPSVVTDYRLIIHCGGCMLTEREVLARMELAKEQGVPVTNYGTAIAKMKGILDRSISVFQKASVRARIRVHGIVQGVGFRPFVWRKATQMGLCGSVCNEGSFVEIVVWGDEQTVHAFEQVLKKEKPTRAKITEIEIEYDKTLSDEEQNRDTDFRIISGANSEGAIYVSPDIAICPQCEAELYDKNNRRFLHPFINCTACGPRLTIMERLPYDRERTVMKTFPMCADCKEEYDNPSTRRFDAQPVCCPSCGPRVYIPGENLWDEKAIIRARQVIREGGIVAVKGIGGFHLCADARNEQAVKLLRERKNRPRKPFAIMARDLEVAKKLCDIHPVEEHLLTGEKKPIVLCEKKADAGNEHLLAEGIAPGNPTLGIMLPYAPLQLLLFDYPDGLPMTDVLVMTSANRAGAPICRTREEVEEQLSDICDLVLSHEREILLRADDSIMEYIDGVPSMLRRSRGYAPLPVQISKNWKGQVLGIGGELKNCFVIGKGELFYPSPYVGDLTDARSMSALHSALERMQELFEAKPQVVVCDMHPDYRTVAFAKGLGLPVIQVQHHYAHILSNLAENDALSLPAPVIGVAFDGTGYGTDGTIWGGEFLLSNLDGFERVGMLAPFVQPGADASAREGFRIAAAFLLASYDEKTAGEIAGELKLCSAEQWEVLAAMCRTGINCATSTSMGRLFDGVSALLGICSRSTYEGEAAMELQFLAEQLTDEQNLQFESLWEEKKARLFPVEDADDGTFHLQYVTLIQSLVTLQREGVHAAVLARLFHEALSDAVVKACIWIRERRALTTVAVSGGCFQNRLLLSLVRKELLKEGFEVLTHALISPNDGGIALGQAVYGMHQLEKTGGNYESAVTDLTRSTK